MMDAEFTIVVFALMMSLSDALVGSQYLGVEQEAGWCYAQGTALSPDVFLDVGDRPRDVLVKDVADHPTMTHSARILAGNKSHHAKTHIF